MSSQTTDEQVFSMKYKNLIPLVVSIVLITNIATGLIIQSNQTAEKTEYNMKRSDRKDKAVEEKMRKERECRILEEKLKICEQGKR